MLGNIFNKKNEKKLSFALGGYKFISDGEYLRYQSAYGKSFNVRLKDVETVTLDKGGAGKNKIKLVGKGTILAEVELPKHWSEKTQRFIFEEIDAQK